MRQRPIIVVVDHDAHVRDGLTRVFRRNDEWDLRMCASCESALALVRAHDADLVVTELVMPGGMGGDEFLATVRQEHPLTLRLLLTATSLGLDPLLESGLAHQLLVKPCSAPAIRAEIRELLQVRERLRRLAPAHSA
jgi:DNA-binding NtrC family response regulator